MHTSKLIVRRRVAAALITVALLSFAPLVILGPAIGWPASLRLPAAAQLAAIAQAPGAVAWGYSVYLVYSVLIAPVFIALAWALFDGRWGATARVVVAFAVMSSLARCIGLLRWLTVMPTLADAHARADAPLRAQIEVLFNALNSYGGGIGELLGVSLFMALALATLCVAAWRQRQMPTGLAAAGVLSAGLLLGMVLQVPVAFAVTALTLWMVAVGVWLWRTRGTASPALSSARAFAER
jgi:Domain of unknown function (DUF4386)